MIIQAKIWKINILGKLIYKLLIKKHIKKSSIISNSFINNILHMKFKKQSFSCFILLYFFKKSIRNWWDINQLKENVRIVNYFWNYRHNFKQKNANQHMIKAFYDKDQRIFYHKLHVFYKVVIIINRKWRIIIS